MKVTSHQRLAFVECTTSTEYSRPAESTQILNQGSAAVQDLVTTNILLPYVGSIIHMQPQSAASFQKSVLRVRPAGQAWEASRHRHVQASYPVRPPQGHFRQCQALDLASGLAELLALPKCMSSIGRAGGRRVGTHLRQQHAAPRCPRVRHLVPALQRSGHHRQHRRADSGAPRARPGTASG